MVDDLDRAIPARILREVPAKDLAKIANAAEYLLRGQLLNLVGAGCDLSLVTPLDSRRERHGRRHRVDSLLKNGHLFSLSSARTSRCHDVWTLKPSPRGPA